MDIEIFPDAESAAEEAARMIAAEARRAVAARGRFVVAFSGGRSPWLMLCALASADVPWDKVDIAQVDERVAPEGDPDRNFTHLRESLLERAPVPPAHVHPMPVEEPNLEAAARRYARLLTDLAGSPAVLDLIHLGIGPDGHTASLVPGDPVLEITDADVAVTGEYQGRRRMTLTYPIINRCRRILWLVTDREKAPALRRLCDGDRTIPAGRVRRQDAVVLADSAAAQELGENFRSQAKP